MKSVKYCLIGLLAGLFALSPVFSPANAQAVALDDSHWFIRCTEASDTAPRACEMYQRLSVKETGRRVAEFAIGFPPEGANDGMARGVALLPLGIMLDQGIQMQVDDKSPFKFRVRYCTVEGCFAFLDLSPPVLDMMRRGNDLLISFQDMRGETVAIEMSLKGFTKTIDEIN